MPQIEDIGNGLAGTLNGYGADYIEVRLEENQTSQITYRGRTLETVNKSASAGGNVRALVKGGWGFVSFNSFEELPKRSEAAVRQASFIGHEKSMLAESEPAVDKVTAGAGKDPGAMPLEDKKELLDGYNEIIWRTPGIQTSTIGYGDGRKRTIFLNSEGSHIDQERKDVTLRLTAIASDGTEVQQVGVSLGSRPR